MMIYEGWITFSSATKDGGGFLKFKSRWCFWRLAKEIWKIETTKQKKRKFTKINMFTKLIQSWRGNTENAYPFFYFIGWTENSTPKILKVITWNRYIKNQSLWMSMDFGTLCLGWTIIGLYHSNFVPNLKVANNIVFFFFILLFGNFCNSPETKKWVLK